MSTHAHDLTDVIPLPDHTWAWSDTDLTRSQFSYLRRHGLIKQIDEQEWRTTEKCIQAIEDYGRIPRDEIGTYVDYDRSWFDTSRVDCPSFDSGGSAEDNTVEQITLDKWGMGGDR